MVIFNRRWTRMNADEIGGILFKFALLKRSAFVRVAVIIEVFDWAEIGG
jgi:hypothetical protein